MRSVLILGGTTEARLLAQKLGEGVVLSLAGRTRAPLLPDVPVRIGGFGGAQGLADYLLREKIAAIVDATHPYAARISANAVQAAKIAQVPLLQVRRPEWVPGAGDKWVDCADVAEVIKGLGSAPRRVFLAMGRQEIAPFATAPQHHYLVRSVDPIGQDAALPDAVFMTARGPFKADDERGLLERHRIDSVVSKNSGGAASYGKITAARELGLPVYMIQRPELPDADFVESVEEAIIWIGAIPIPEGAAPAADRH
jgi:precorrin-6A/cobalt-precorrin-6A reductase